MEPRNTVSVDVSYSTLKGIQRIQEGPNKFKSVSCSVPPQMKGQDLESFSFEDPSIEDLKC